MDGIEAWKSAETICESAGGELIYAQVDGEPVGPLPVAFRIVPDALSIVTPDRQL
jgi:diacylglycerol kinase family enzyme